MCKQNDCSIGNKLLYMVRTIYNVNDIKNKIISVQLVNFSNFHNIILLYNN